MHATHILACTIAMKRFTSSTFQSCVAVSCQQHWARWEQREKRGKQAETEWKKGCRQHLYSVVLWPPKRPWKVLGGTKLQSLWCLWIRGVDRRESGQQGCSTESGRRYAGAFRRTERKVEGKDFLSHKSRGTVSHWGAALSCWGVILGVPQGSDLIPLPNAWQKTQSFPWIIREFAASESQRWCTQEKCRCMCSFKGWLIMGVHIGTCWEKSSHLFTAPMLLSWYILKHLLLASFLSYIE